MQLSNLFPIAAELEIDFPDGTPTGITLSVVGQDSKQFRLASKKVAATMLGNEDARPDIDTLEKQGAEMVAACIVGWDGLEEGDAPIPFSSAKAIELMSMPELAFIRAQVEGFVTKRTNFFRARN